MSEEEARPEPDRIEGAPHPRETAGLVGQENAEAGFLEAYGSNRLHHAWLIAGPAGIGKATLAWRIARFLLADPPSARPPSADPPAASPPEGATDLFGNEGDLFGAVDTPPPPSAPSSMTAAPTTLDIPPEHPVARRLLALSEPRLFLLRRSFDEKAGRLRREITIDGVRGLRRFFELSAADGGRRVAIVDAADEMNPNAANALLKLLEEPPPDSVILLVSHQPSRLLPTIRSRCRTLRCVALSPDAVAEVMARCDADPGPDAPRLATLSAGSAGAALRLFHLDGLALYADILALFGGGRLDRRRAIGIADDLAARGAESRLDLAFQLFELFLARLARAGVGGPPAVEAAPGEAALFSKISPGPAAARNWATLQQELGTRAREGREVNLDPAALILDMAHRIQEMSAKCSAG